MYKYVMEDDMSALYLSVPYHSRRLSYVIVQFSLESHGR